jgi:signal transduction histidine kinase
MVEAHSATPARNFAHELVGGPVAPALQATIDALKGAVAILGASGDVLAVNSAWRAAAADEEVGHCPLGDNYLDWCRTLEEEFAGASFARRVARVLAGVDKAFESVWRPAGGSCEVRVCVARIKGQIPARFLVSHEISRTSLLDVEDCVLRAQIEERERLAAELHDSVGQNLVCLGLGLTRLRRLPSQEPELAAILDDMAASLQQAHAEIRTLSFLLQPPWLEERGAFEKAICDLVAGFARRSGLQAKCEASKVTLCRARQLTLFRILQETLVNVHRHARADNLEVELARRGRSVVLKVHDDGHGMAAPEGAPPNPGVGILGMRARLRKFGGDLLIVSGRDGTTVTAKLPV